MQINTTTDYAIRTLLYLATVGRLAGSAEIAEKMQIPRQYLITMMNRLKRGGFLTAQGGPKGGYALQMPPEEITLLSILQIMEGTTKLNRCLEDDRYCSRFATENCPVRRCYVRLQAQIEGYLASVTIADLLDGKTPPPDTLPPQ